MSSVGSIDAGLVERLLAHIEIVGSCWLWTGMPTPAGYGQIGDRSGECKRTFLTHRLAYRIWCGPIPDDRVIDHTCHTNDASCLGGPRCPHRRCMNPEHLALVTSIENVMLGHGGAAVNATKTTCSRGHRLIGPNVRFRKGSTRGPWRQCLVCLRFTNRQLRLARGLPVRARGRAIVV